MRCQPQLYIIRQCSHDQFEQVVIEMLVMILYTVNLLLLIMLHSYIGISSFAHELLSVTLTKWQVPNCETGHLAGLGG